MLQRLANFVAARRRTIFVRRMLRAARAALVDQPITFDQSGFRLLFPDKPGSFLNLQNAYNDYVRAGLRGKRVVIREYVASALALRDIDEKEAPFDVVRPRLLPRVRERAYYGAFDLLQRIERAKNPSTPHKGEPLDSFVIRPFADLLTLEIVEDLPKAIRTVNADAFTKWNVPFDEVLAVARDNLWKISNENFKPVRPGVLLSPWHDTHDASRLMLHDLIWQLPVRGRHVAAVPNRNVLLVTGEDDPDGLASMAELIGVVLKDPRPMTGTAFVLDGCVWKPFLPPADHPARAALHAVAAQQTARDYADQTEALNQWHKATGQDVFVAKQNLMQRPDGTLFSWAIWVENVTDALLPEADWIVFGGSSGKTYGVAPYNRVKAVVGHRMDSTDLYPPRYRVRSFPTAEERDRIGLLEKFG